MFGGLTIVAWRTFLRKNNQAIFDYDEAIRQGPKEASPVNNKAYLLATAADDKVLDVARARDLMKQVIELRKESPYNEETWSVIAAAQGRFEDAIKHQKKALEDKDYAESEGDKAKERLKAYEQKKPWRE